MLVYNCGKICKLMISLVLRLLIIFRTDSSKFELIVSCVFGWNEDVGMMIIYNTAIQSELNPCKVVKLPWSSFLSHFIELLFKLEWQGLEQATF